MEKRNWPISMATLTTGVVEQEFGNLSFAEKEKVLHDVRGTDNIVKEAPELIAEKLQDIRKELSLLPFEKKTAYTQALIQEVKMETNYCRGDTFLLMFLRADLFDASKAALRVIEFFKIKIELFGLSKVHRAIVQADLNKDDKEALFAGFHNYCCGKDNGGRKIICIRKQRLRNKGLISKDRLINIQRAMFYHCMAMLEQSEDIQKKGVVVINWTVGSSPPWNEYLTLSSNSKMMLNSIPTRIVAFHQCYNDMKELLFSTTCLLFVPKKIIVRFNRHFGSAEDCFERLASFGINTESLPMRYEITNQIQNKIDPMIQQLVEMQQKEESNSSRSNSGKDQNNYGSELRIMSEEVKSNPIPSDGTVAIKNSTVHSSTWNDDGSENYDEDNDSKASKSTELDSADKESKGMVVSSEDTASIQNSGFASANDDVTSDVEIQRVGEAKSCQSNDSGDLKHQNNSIPRDRDKFPQRLMEVLLNGTAKESIWWISDGTAFAIDRKKFSSDIITKEFYGIKYDSFLRTLRRWGFKRVRNVSLGTNTTAYCHPLFKREVPDKIRMIRYEYQTQEAPVNSSTGISVVGDGKSSSSSKASISNDLELAGRFVGSRTAGGGNDINQTALAGEETANQNLILQHRQQLEHHRHQQQILNQLQRQMILDQQSRSILDQQNILRQNAELSGLASGLLAQRRQQQLLTSLVASSSSVGQQGNSLEATGGGLLNNFSPALSQQVRDTTNNRLNALNLLFSRESNKKRRR